MPQFSLFLTARLQGITNLRPADSGPEDEYEYSFKVQCTSCREIHPNWVTINRHQLSPVPNSRDEASFIWRCPHCSHQHTAHFEFAPTGYPHSDPPARQSIIRFDCRGLEFVAFRPMRDRWIAEGLETGTVFDDVDLSATAADSSGVTLPWVEANSDGFLGGSDGRGERGDDGAEDGIVWTGYDERSSEEVAIEEVKWGIGRDEEKKGKKKR